MIKSVKPLPELKKRVLSPKQLSKHNFKLGQSGEQQASNFLKQKGYQILASNLRKANKEIDLVAWDKKRDELAFVEVKTRKNSDFGHPSQAVRRNKLRKMYTVASAFLKKYSLDKDYRFDIIAILPGKIEYFENVSWEI